MRFFILSFILIVGSTATSAAFASAKTKRVNVIKLPVQEEILAFCQTPNIQLNVIQESSFPISFEEVKAAVCMKIGPILDRGGIKLYGCKDSTENYEGDPEDISRLAVTMHQGMRGPDGELVNYRQTVPVPIYNIRAFVMRKGYRNGAYDSRFRGHAYGYIVDEYRSERSVALPYAGNLETFKIDFERAVELTAAPLAQCAVFTSREKH